MKDKDYNKKSPTEILEIFKKRFINPQVIRDRHLAIANLHKNTLVNYISDHIDIPDKEFLKSKFKHRSLS